VKLLYLVLVYVVHRLDPQPKSFRGNDLPCEVNSLVDEGGNVEELEGTQSLELLLKLLDLLEERGSPKIGNPDRFVN